MTKQIRKYSIFLGSFLIIFMAGVFAENSIADMYKWVDENGVVHFSDTPRNFKFSFTTPHHET